MTRITVETYEFQRSHGKQPRGTGYWGFFFGSNRDALSAFWSNSTYAQAKAAAVAKAREDGFTLVSVAP